MARAVAKKNLKNASLVLLLENRYHACSGPPHPELWVHCSPLGEQIPCMFRATPSRTLGTLFSPWRTDTMHVQGHPIQNFGYTVHPLENRYQACSGPPHPELWVHCSPLGEQIPCMFRASPSRTLGTLFTPWRTDTMHVMHLIDLWVKMSTFSTRVFPQ